MVQSNISDEEIGSFLPHLLTPHSCSMFMLMFIANSSILVCGFCCTTFFHWHWKIGMSNPHECAVYSVNSTNTQRMNGDERTIEPQRAFNGFWKIWSHIFELRESNGWLISFLLHQRSCTKHRSMIFEWLESIWRPFETIVGVHQALFQIFHLWIFHCNHIPSNSN